MSSLEFVQYTFINKQQIHLTTIDVQNGKFFSKFIKITCEKTKYGFQQCNQRKTIGQIKLLKTIVDNENNKYSILEGKDTEFEHEVKKGENIVIKGEKSSIIDILSNTQ